MWRWTHGNECLHTHTNMRNYSHKSSLTNTNIRNPSHKHKHKKSLHKYIRIQIHEITHTYTNVDTTHTHAHTWTNTKSDIQMQSLNRSHAISSKEFSVGFTSLCANVCTAKYTCKLIQMQLAQMRCWVWCSRNWEKEAN